MAAFASIKLSLLLTLTFTVSYQIQLGYGLSIDFIHDLQFQCPLSISPSLPIEMDGDALDEALSSGLENSYTVVLFYASWCPFSQGLRSKFDVLSSIFPQFRHLAVEHSLAMPSVFSRYGIHSLPTILMVNQTSKVAYHGRKDLSSLFGFYKRTTGLKPAVYMLEAYPESSITHDQVLHPQTETSLKDTLRRDPYVVFSVLFLFLRAVLYFFPGISYRLKALWVSYALHLNLGIFGESSQLVGRVLHLIDVKRVWSKLKQCKIGGFQKGAKSMRVWASSMASVSLKKTSSA